LNGLIEMSERREPSSPIHLAPKELVAWLAGQWRDSVSNPDSPYRLPILVTMAGSPAGRTVVVREAGESPLEVHFHTDLRSAKVAQLRESPACLLVWYDARSRIQVQARGQARLHSGDERARQAWEPLPVHNGRQYGQVEFPGTSLSHPLAEVLPEKEDGWRNFCLGIVGIADLELLQLDRDGNIRCRVEPSGGGWIKKWIAP